MYLSRRLRTPALIFLILAICIPSTLSRFHGLRQKRQNGANLYLPASSIVLGGEGDDPSEWSEWSSPSECSRSCGGGVSYQTRECLRVAPNGTPMCRGGNRKYFSCNTQDCPEDEADFRVQQCKRFNHVPFDGMYYDWVPYTNAPNPCELNCMPVGERFYYRQKEKVADGTRCNDKDLDVCVDGECQPVGCDMMLGSDAKEDKCRKCGGDGSTCQTIKQTFTTSNLAAGYNDILLIPTGATNIRVQETVPSNNYLACRNLTGHYYLNGNWRIDFPRPMFYANAWWTYQRKPNGFAAPDQLTCSGPISESIYIVMLVQDKNVSIDYEYSIPDTLSQNTPGVYTWTHMEFDECSAPCGGGTQSRVVKCNNRITLEEVDASLCDANLKPSESQACGQEPCAPHWVEGEWGKCSKGCGADGMQNRTISCERTSPSGERTVEEDAVCLQLVGNKPATTQECNRDVKNCPKYFLGPWSPCDKLCGDGKQKRKVTCYIEENGHKKVLPEDDCVEEKPETEQDCMLAPCEGVDWIISEWSGCTACGQNVETRTAICSSKSGKVYPEEFCAPEVPLLSRPCKSAKCETQWFTSEWSKCSADCGKGIQSRIVICGEFDGTTVTPAADDTKCNAATKPSGEQECEGEEKECPGQWFTGPWAKCSKPCGGGERVREVLCLANGTKSSNCDASKIESSSEKCNTEACTEDEIIPVDSTAKPIEEDDYDDSEECGDDEDDGDDVELLDKKAAAMVLGAGVPVGEEESTTSPLLLDELMQSDAPTTLDDTESTASTFEGSGDETDITVTTDIDGSGDDTESTTDALDTSESTDLSSTSEGLTESTESSTGSSSSVDTTTDDLSTVEGSGTDSSTETGSTDLSSSTDSTASPLSTESTESATEQSSATDSSSLSTSDDSTSTENTATDSSTEALSSSSSLDTTDSSTSTESATETTQSNDSTTDSSTDSSSDSSSASAETTTETSETTESSTSDSSTISTVDTTLDSSTVSSTDASSSDASTDITTDGTTEGSSSSTPISESSSAVSSVSTETTTDTITESATSDSTTEGNTSTDETTDASSPSSESTDASASTEIGGTTETGITDETTDGSTDESTDSSTDVSGGSTTIGNTESTEASSSTDSSSSEASTTESATESTSETSTDSSSDGSTDISTDSSVSLDETTQDIWSSTDTTEDDDMEKSTPFTLEAAIRKESKATKCKLRKKKDCTKTEFGCCPDKKTVAKGPFDEGCPVAKTCEDTKYGCCPDGISPAQGKKNKGCPKSQCAESLFGCCPDKFTAAEGEDNEGCPEPTTLPPTTTTEIPTTEAPEEESVSSTEGLETTEAPEGVVKSCSFAEFGCCPDGKTEATGKDFAGCDVPQISPQDCRQSAHGCCPDNRTPATGPDGEGCAACTQEPFGCCPDKQTPAHGPLGEGCCLNTEFGCCPDNINSARGPNFEDCDCKYTPYGCCPDNKSAARGPSNEGCSCETSQFGCCPDKLTPANGPKYEGCACHTMQFGCCPDGLTIAQGPHHYGCHCSHTEFKCCPDEKTPAKGPNEEGCTCLESKYGCCPDGVSAAQGDKFEGCENVKEPPQKACGLPKETGSCSNFSIKYFFDTSYGACARFWYGGCEGNENRFDNEEDCKATCQDYTGKEACYLPKSSGPCTGYNKKWYFDADRQRCEEFNYGGCYGTNNRFDSLDECQSMCSVSESTPPCDQPMEEGPCEGNFERWYYDNATDICRPFRYGGCKGNKNNYPTEYACSYHCRQPGVHKDYCSLPKQTGDCSEQHARWYFSESDKKCLPFYYTGCGGNKNNFPSLESCEDHCPKEVVKDVCEIPSEVGECTNYVAMWYYDTKDERCRQFYYGGCGGNDNKFATEEACLQRCEKKPEPEPTVKEPETAGSVCDLEQSAGDCSDFVIQWYYSKADRSCRQFYYGGCGGNGNRFQSREECDQQCTAPTAHEPQQPQQPAQPQQPNEQDLCSKPSEVGDCADYELKWFYNETEASCMQFYYGGCGGNDNRFDTEEDCSKRCSTPDVDQRYNPYPTPANNTRPYEETEKCFLQASFGDCDNNETRWYYNHEEGLCDEFVFSGCGGNSNNFETEDDCLNSCDHVQTTCSLPPARGRCNDNATRWYFDERVGRCFEFEFGGCRGNKNNFVTESECMQFCTNERSQPESQQPTFSVCELPAEAGECDNRTTAWFYDTESLNCVAFSYSGCGGNGNRFETKEQCDRQCGEFKGIDVCNEPVMTGPCRQWQTRFYYNKESRTCEPFTYGGCDGTGNRFADRAECQSVCIVGNEPQPHDNKDICKLPASVGKCNGLSVYERRWYYDDERGSCLSFIYSGCSGNQNNFRSFEACNNYCGKTEPDTNEITNNEVLPNKCEANEEECRQLRCPYGVRRVAADNDCTRCQCENPCESYECPEGQQCAVDLSSDAANQFIPVCRETNKRGECPYLATNSSSCARECYTDADCRGDNKCCSDGCGFLCVRPTQPTRPTERPTTQAPVIVYPGDSKAALEPKQPEEVNVQTAVGGIAVLRCFATGSPPPNVTWSLHDVVIDTNQGRFVLTSSGDLTIVQVRQTDSGSYVCVASNGLGDPVRREVELRVTEPENKPAYIYGDKNATQIVTLNMPAQIRCPAGGYPAPHVSWWRNRKKLGLVGDRFEQTRDYSLIFRSIQLADLGPYSCEVYNNRGRPSSMTVTLKAVGPARAVNNADAPYLQYIIDPAIAPATQRPAYPYRPTRPSFVPPPPVYVEPPRPQTVSAQAVIAVDPRNTYSPGSAIAMSCAVQGSPIPEVTWSKDGIPLRASERIQITAQPHRLVVNNVSVEDSGSYACTARNAVSYSTSEQTVTIESSLPINPDCVDNPYFANCQLIIKGRYCKNHYYAKFCCRSCTLAGQLGDSHPNAV